MMIHKSELIIKHGECICNVNVYNLNLFYNSDKLSADCYYICCVY